MKLARAVVLSLSVLAICGIGGFASAQTAEFYRGKQLNIMVGGTAGSGVDQSARLIARYLGKHLPGNPTITVQIMGGAGGIRVVEFLHSIAPRDGTAIAALPPGPLLEPLIGARKASYSMADFTAVGAMSKDVSLCVSAHDTPFKTIDDVKAKEMVVGGTGAGSNPDVFPTVLNRLIGTKFKLITGYVGSQEIALAMERKEVQGRCGWGVASVKSTRPDWLRDKKVNILLQFALEKSPELPDVPLVFEFLKDPADKQLMTLLLAPLGIARPFLAPPGLPAERAAELRKAFMAAMQDEELRAEGRKIGLDDIDPTSGEDMQRLLQQIYATPEPVVEQARAMLSK
jgi:tripartite-type tricarboxylate transporter receptor subunit TctC